MLGMGFPADENIDCRAIKSRGIMGVSQPTSHLFFLEVLRYSNLGNPYAQNKEHSFC